jgi:LL-diaminopimelate aminotransferase
MHPTASGSRRAGGIAVRLADRMDAVPPYVFQTLGAKLHQLRQDGHDIIDLGISDPDVGPPPAVVARLHAAVDAPGMHRYPPYAGTRALREAVAAWYQRRFGVEVNPETEVLVTQGSKEALVHLAFAFCNPGDVILVPDPAFPAYAMAGVLLGAHVHRLPLTPDNGYLPDLATVPPAVAARARLLYVNYPNNPTGRVAPRSAYADWVAWCRAHDAVLVSDLAYVDIVYRGRAVSALEIPEARSVALESVTWSKGYGMQGWRVGALVGASALIEPVLRIESNINAGVFLPVQQAAETALTAEPVPGTLARYRARRDAALRVLREAGIAVEEPEGAVYLWIRTPDGDMTAAEALAAGVAVTPGSAFGPGSRGYVRVSLTHPIAQLTTGLRRLARVLAVGG